MYPEFNDDYMTLAVFVLIMLSILGFGVVLWLKIKGL